MTSLHDAGQCDAKVIIEGDGGRDELRASHPRLHTTPIAEFHLSQATSRRRTRKHPQFFH